MPVPVTRFAFVSRSYRLAIGSLLGLLLLSCNSSVDSSRHTSSRTNGVAGGSIETITHTDETTKARVAEVQYDRDSLAAGQTISVSSTYQTDPEEVAENFGIGSDNTVTTTDVAVVVTSNVDKNLEKPMTIALDLPSGGAGLLDLIWENRTYIVVYTVKDSKTGKWKRGIKPDSDLTVKNNQVVFQSTYLGRYEVFETKKELKTKHSPVAVKTQDFSTPPVAITNVSPAIATAGDEITLRGRYLTAKSQVFVGGERAKTRLVKPGVMSVSLPALSTGKTTITVKEVKSQDIAELVVKAVGEKRKIIDALPADVCQGQEYLDAKGTPQNGSKNCGPDTCKEEGRVGCLATEAFPALSEDDVPYENLVDSVTVFQKPGDVTVPATSKPCDAEGQAGCLITGDFVALKKGQFSAEDLRKGVVLDDAFTNTNGGITGTYPSPGNPLKPSSEGWTGLDSDNFSAAIAGTSQEVYKFWDKTGTAHTFKPEGSLTPAAIVKDVTIHGVKGETPDGPEPHCQTHSDRNCYIKSPYVAVGRATIVPHNIRKDRIVGGVTGTYPSADAPMEPVPAEPELTSSTFNEALSSGKAYVYYDSAGNRKLTKFDPNLKGSHIRKGVTLFGKAGTLGTIDTNVYKPIHIREGVKFGNITGTMRVGCRNQANRGKFNYDGDFGSGDLDPFDTIQDGVLPNQNPWTGKGQYVCAQDVWEDLTNEGCTAPTDRCVIRNKHTGRLWGKFVVNPKTYTQAFRYCYFKLRNQKRWSVPSIHLLMQAYNYGLNFFPSTGTLRIFEKSPLWSVTKKHNSDPKQGEQNIPLRVFDPKTGLTSHKAYSGDETYVLCTIMDESY